MQRGIGVNFATCLQVLSALPVQYIAVYWLTTELWVAWIFAFKWLKSIWDIWGQFSAVLARLFVDPITARIYHAGFVLLVATHIVSCGFMALAHHEGNENTEYITDIPNFVTGHAQYTGGSLTVFQYTQAWDWSIKTMTGLSRGNSIPKTDLQHCYMLFTVIMGIILYALMITTISDALSTPSLEARHRCAAHGFVWCGMASRGVLWWISGSVVEEKCRL